MRRLVWRGTLILIVAALWVAVTRAQVMPPSAFVLDGSYDMQVYGNDSPWSQGLTHRYVGGELRFLNMNLHGALQEWRIGATPFGGTITQVTNSWQLGGVVPGITNFTGFWYEQAMNRLWMTSGPDYTVQIYPTMITTLTLNTNGTVSNIHRVSLQGINGKRVYGGALKLSASVAAALGCGPYVVGFGGYTSLVAQGGGASMGPTAYCIPEPTTYLNGAEIPATAFRKLLDAFTSRGVRIWTSGTWPAGSPVNYFDLPGGTNFTSRPTAAPAAGSQWLSPNAQGLGWMVWGDSAYNTGMWIERNGKTAFAQIWSLCKGFCWYQSSTLKFDGREFELQLWDPATLGDGILTRPTSRTELVLPRGNTVVWSGNVTIGNVAGATYDATTGKMYVIGMALGASVNKNRLYQYSVDGGGTTTTTTSVPTTTTTVTTTTSVTTTSVTTTTVPTTTVPTTTTSVSTTTTTAPTTSTTTSTVPPENPCLSHPGVLSVTTWPSSLEGARTLRYTYTVSGVVTAVRTVFLEFVPVTQLTVTDARTCVKVRVK